MSVNVNLFFTVKKLKEDVASVVRKDIEKTLAENYMDGDVQDIEGIKYDAEGLAQLEFGNDWSQPLSISGISETLEKLERDLRAAISKHQADYEFKLGTEFPDEQ